MDKLLDLLERILLNLTSGLFFFIVLLTLVQVFYRYVLNDALSWSAELTRIIFIWMTFLGSAVAINRNRHMRIDTIVSILPARAQIYVDILVHIGIIIFLVVAGYQSLAIIERAHTAVTGALRWPRSVMFLPLLIGGGFMTVYSLRHIVGQIRSLREPGEA